MLSTNKLSIHYAYHNDFFPTKVRFCTKVYKEKSTGLFSADFSELVSLYFFLFYFHLLFDDFGKLIG